MCWAGLVEPCPTGTVDSICGHLPPQSPFYPPRLLRSLVSLKQVIINAAHYLVLGDKETYHFDPEAPFLQMVSPYLGSTRGTLWRVQSLPKSWGIRVCLLLP